MSRKSTTLEIRAKRSGIIPGFITLAVGGVLLDYDAGHWHVLRHLLGSYSVPVAFIAITMFTAFVVRLCSRPAGRASITSSKEKENAR
jgi:hypothetical protein